MAGHFSCDDIMDDGGVGLFGVLDGHGGSEVVDYCTKMIPEVIILHQNFLYKKIIDIQRNEKNNVTEKAFNLL